MVGLSKDSKILGSKAKLQFSSKALSVWLRSNQGFYGFPSLACGFYNHLHHHHHRPLLMTVTAKLPRHRNSHHLLPLDSIVDRPWVFPPWPLMAEVEFANRRHTECHLICTRRWRHSWCHKHCRRIFTRWPRKKRLISFQPFCTIRTQWLVLGESVTPRRGFMQLFVALLTRQIVLLLYEFYRRWLEQCAVVWWIEALAFAGADKSYSHSDFWVASSEFWHSKVIPVILCVVIPVYFAVHWTNKNKEKFYCCVSATNDLQCYVMTPIYINHLDGF